MNLNYQFVFRRNIQLFNKFIEIPDIVQKSPYLEAVKVGSSAFIDISQSSDKV